MRILKLNEMSAVSGGFGTSGQPKPKTTATPGVGDCPSGMLRASWSWEREASISGSAKGGNKLVNATGSASGSSGSKGSFDGCVTKEQAAEAASKSMPPAK